jgi:serine/threonine-protein kinase
VILGTAGYLAPEQVRTSMGAIGPATDVFALGAIIYRALTGVPAFPARDVAAAIDEALHHHPRPPSTLVSTLPRDVDLVVALALVKSPAGRTQRAGDLARDLAAAAAGALSETVRARARGLPGLPIGGDGSPFDETLSDSDSTQR